MLSPLATFVCSAAVSSCYVGSIYLLPSTRTRHSPPASPDPLHDVAASAPAASPPRDRNHPSVIKARLLAVTLASLSSCAAVPSILTHSQPRLYPSYRDALPRATALLGLALPATTPDLARLVLCPLGLTASLFLGSLYVAYLDGDLPGQRGASTCEDWKRKFDGCKGVRNYVAAPLTEELTFRSCILAISALGGWSVPRLVFLSPLWFGLAHVHHARETYIALGRTRRALLIATAQSLFQLAYTTLFGWYASFLFLRTGSIIPPFLAHAFCNAMGVPPLGWALRVWPEKKLAIIASYSLGIATFVYNFNRWTEPALFGLTPRGRWGWL
ncbi:prenyl protein peptidase [Rhodotorula toruloides]|uniref:intramembrane prenyl-peptidase Rce1 n=1 Tax=Rhodotorula toruloides TaxID=5286 RepID=A0A511KA63_RHOTO|nr:prenyl protein peptidase [Rhodotorula toruloides]